MTRYQVYLESGPQKRKTIVHVPALLGCLANGPTTEDALAATPEAIATYRRFLQSRGEKLSGDDEIEVDVADHIMAPGLGQGMSKIDVPLDFDPPTAAQLKRYLQRDTWICEILAGWVETVSDAQLDADPSQGSRPARRILSHVLGARGAYLAAALGGAPGFGRLRGAAERGELPLAEAFRQSAELMRETVSATTDEQRRAVRQLSSGRYTLHKGIRHELEHGWEHLAELSRFPDGPRLYPVS